MPDPATDASGTASAGGAPQSIQDVRRTARPRVSLVVPVLDEAGSVAELAARVEATLRGLGLGYELLFVDDGSRDDTPQRIVALHEASPAVKLIRFTRNFGHQRALAAGLAFAEGDVVMTLDADLQHPPELLPEFLERWKAGADVVNGVRRERTGRLTWKERSSRAFYRVMNRLAEVDIVPGGADFRLLDRRVVDALNTLPERFLFVRGLVPWLGFASASVAYDQPERAADVSKYRFRRMLQLALDAIVSFSVVPLRLIAVIGAVTALLGVAYGIFALAATALGATQPGWSSIVVLVLVFGGIQLLAIGVLSEYVGRIYEETKRRPRFVIDRMVGIPWPRAAGSAKPDPRA